MTGALYGTVALAHAAVLVWAILRFPKERTLAVGSLVVLAAALTFDNAVVALGRTVAPDLYEVLTLSPEGTDSHAKDAGGHDTLRALSYGRFLAHAILTPIIVLTACSLARRAGAVRSRPGAAEAVTIALVVVGLLSLVGLDLEPIAASGTLRFAEPEATPPIAAILAVLIGIWLGWRVFRHTGWAVLFVGFTVMFIASAVPATDAGPVVGNVGEIALLTSVAVTIARGPRDATTAQR